MLRRLIDYALALAALSEKSKPEWDIEAAINTYNVDGWGGGYFTVNAGGNAEVRPLQEGGGSIDVMEVVNEARSRGLGFPLVIRFQDLLRHRPTATRFRSHGKRRWCGEVLSDLQRKVRERLRLRLRSGLRRPPVVVSFPKSGRTQLRMMLHTASIAAEFSHAGSSDEHAREAVELASGPVHWRRHRVLFMMRDARDTAVSAWFHARHRSRVYGGALESFLRDSRFGLEKIVLFHLLWLERRASFRGFALLEYEALQRSPVEAFAHAASFLGNRDLPETKVRAAVEAGSFEAMRKLEASGAGGALFGPRLSPGDADRHESYKTRRGAIGGWREDFTPGDVAFAEDMFDRHDYRRRLAEAGATPPGPSQA